MVRTDDVRFALVPSPHGTALVAARGDTVVASYLPVRDGTTLTARLHRDFPAAREAPAARVTGAVEMRAWLAGRPTAVERVPVDLAGTTPFRRRVYAALRKVPAGSTTTYGALARRVGSPGGARAVGGAMAANALAPFVPCHRVLGADGALGGYSAERGPALKRELLDRECGARVGRRGMAGGGANP